MSESTPKLPFRAVVSGGVGLNIEDANHGTVCFGFGDRTHLADFVVDACNAHDELLAACKAWVSFYHGDIPVPEGEPADDAVVAAFAAAERKIVDAMTAAIAAAEGGE